jgi:Calx-beta domain
MRTIARLLTFAATVTLVGLSLVPAAQAAKPHNVFTVYDGASYEYVKTCADTAPFSCGTFAESMFVQIVGPYPPKNYPITLTYRIEPITATAGADYTLSSGTAAIAAGQYVTGIRIPLVADGVAEPNETFRVRLTSSSIGGNISDTGIGTIWNDGQIPPDCNLSKPDLITTSMTCTNRPAGQRWQHIVTCGDIGAWGYVRAYGPVVTGNGTSTAVCDDFAGYDESQFYVVT